MDRARKWFLIASYCTVALAIFLIVAIYTFRLVDLGLFVSLTGSLLALFQIIQAFHIYWKQNVSDEEVKAIMHILSIPGAKEVAKLLCDHDSLSFEAMHKSFHGSKTALANALFALEDKKIIRTRPYFDTAGYIRLFRLNPKFKRIVERFRLAF